MEFKLIVLLICMLINCINSQNSTNSTTLTSNRLFKSFNKFKSVFNTKLLNKTNDQTNLIFQLSKIGRENKTSPTTNNKPKKIKQLNKPDIQSKGISQIKSIYQNIKSGSNHYYDNINTIRLVPSTKVESSKKLYFLFNLSLISPTEHLIKTDLYINRKYIKQKLEFDLHYFLYSSQSNKRNLNVTNTNKRSVLGSSSSSSAAAAATIYLKNSNTNHQQWQSFSIYDSIKSYLDMRNSKHLYNSAKSNNNNNNNNKNVYYTLNQEASAPNQVETDELVLIMEATNFNKNRKTHMNRLNLSDILNPYLMIYTRETEMNMKSFFQTRTYSKLLDKLTFKSTDSELEDLKQFESDVDRQNESVDSNELIQETTTKAQDLIKMNTPTKLSQIETYLIEKSKANDPYFSYLPKVVRKRSVYSEEDVFDDKLLPVVQSSSISDNVNNNKCSTKSILIDFDDMSFSDWIIEPKRFTSNYCSGTCRLPFNQINYSNYATLQLILNSLKMNDKNVPPEPCCSPTQTESLPILYMDKNSNDYVVKLLPDMIIKDCSCR